MKSRLGCEIRSVPQLDKRLNEAARLGFKQAVVPLLFFARNLQVPSGLQIVHVDRVDAAMDIFG